MRLSALIVALGFALLVTATSGDWARMDRAELLIAAIGLISCGGIIYLLAEIDRIDREAR